jgi:hypothetical protein
MYKKYLIVSVWAASLLHATYASAGNTLNLMAEIRNKDATGLNSTDQAQHSDIKRRQQLKDPANNLAFNKIFAERLAKHRRSGNFDDDEDSSSSGDCDDDTSAQPGTSQTPDNTTQNAPKLDNKVVVNNNIGTSSTFKKATTAQSAEVTEQRFIPKATNTNGLLNTMVNSEFLNSNELSREERIKNIEKNIEDVKHNDFYDDEERKKELAQLKEELSEIKNPTAAEAEKQTAKVTQKPKKKRP